MSSTNPRTTLGPAHPKGPCHFSLGSPPWRQTKRSSHITLLTSPVKSAFTSIMRHGGASAIAVATLTFMLTALTIFIVLANGMSIAASGLESKANLIADVRPQVSPYQALELASVIEEKWPDTSVTYTNKSEALRQFKKTFSGNSTMLSALQGNPLPASLNVRTRDPKTLSKIALWLRSNPNVTHLIFNPNLTHKLIEITAFVKIVGIALVAGLTFLAIVIVVNTTHLAVQARREEIEVMRLIGATAPFVRNPFILEGIILGVVRGVGGYGTRHVGIPSNLEHDSRGQRFRRDSAASD